MRWILKIKIGSVFSAQIYVAFKKVLPAVSPEMAALSSLLPYSNNKKCPSSDLTCNYVTVAILNSKWIIYGHIVY